MEDNEFLDAVAMEGNTSQAPQNGSSNTLTLHLQARDPEATGPVVVELSTDDLVDIPVPIVAALVSTVASTVVAFPVVPLASGSLRLTATVRNAAGEMLGQRDWILDIPDIGAGATYQDHLPMGPWAAEAIQVNPTSPGAGTYDVDAGTADSETPPQPVKDGALGSDPENQADWGVPGDTFAGFGFAPVPSTVQVRACVGYYLEQSDMTTIWAPQRDLTVVIRDSDGAGGQLFQNLDLRVTGTDGCFTSAFIPTYEYLANPQDIYLLVKYCGSRSCVLESITATEATYSFHTGTKKATSQVAGIVDFGKIAPKSSRFAAAVNFQYLNDAQRLAATTTLPDGQVQAYLDCPAWLCGEGAHYNLVTQQLWLSTKAAKNPFVVVHEWGHNKMHKLQYLDWNLPLEQAYQRHDWCSVEVPQLAWTEGFANFMSAWVINKAPGHAAGLPAPHGGYAGPGHEPVYMFSDRQLEDNLPCSADHSGHAHEANVATSLWDLIDNQIDGEAGDLDFGSGNSISTLASAIDCFPVIASYADFASCWESDTGVECQVTQTAFGNKFAPRIDINQKPTGSVTDPTSYAWHRAYMSSQAAGADPEGCTLTFEMYASPDATCASTDFQIDSQSTGYEYWDTAAVADDATVYICARGDDGMELGAWSMSPAFGVDNTQPVPDLIHTCSSAGNAGWCKTLSAQLRLDVSDAMSGVASKSCTWRGSGISCGSSSRTGVNGFNTAGLTATDAAGNSVSQSMIVKMDAVPPSGWASPRLELDGIDVDWSASDATSGLASIVVEESVADVLGLLGVSWTAVCSSSPGGAGSEAGTCHRDFDELPLPGNYCYRLQIEDVAGHATTTAPQCILKLEPL